MAADLSVLSAVAAALPGIARAVVDADTTTGGGALEAAAFQAAREFVPTPFGRIAMVGAAVAMPRCSCMASL